MEEEIKSTSEEDESEEDEEVSLGFEKTGPILEVKRVMTDD